MQVNFQDSVITKPSFSFSGPAHNQAELPRRHKKFLKAPKSVASITEATKSVPVSKYKTQFIQKIAKWNILGLSFLVYTFGDLISLLVSTAENKKQNPQDAYALFCQNVAFLLCNLVVYWGAVFGIKKLSVHFSKQFVVGHYPLGEAAKASAVLSDFMAIAGGLPFNDFLKPIIASGLTNYLINNPIQWLNSLFGVFPKNNTLPQQS